MPNLSPQSSVLSPRLRIAVLLSGRGSNFAAIDDAIRRGVLDAEIVCVISNRPDAPGLDLARARKHHAHAIDHRDFSSRAAHEAEVLRILDSSRPDFIILAGYMRLLSPAFIAEFPHAVINIHHSFLPAFAGADPYGQAFERGVKIIGATAHYATEELDEGPIIEQDVVRVSHRDTRADLVRLGREVERSVLARAVQWHVEDRVLLHGNKTIVFN